MYVSKDVQTRPHPIAFPQQENTAQAGGQVEVILGRAMRDEDVRIVWHRVRPCVLAAWVLECEDWGSAERDLGCAVDY